MKRSSVITLSMTLAIASSLACKSREQAKDVDAAPPQPASKPLSQLLSGTKPGPPTPLAKVHVGMTFADAKSAAPELFTLEENGAPDDFAAYAFHVEGYDDVTCRVRVLHGKVAESLLNLPEGSLAALEAAWGKPRVRTKALAYWFNPEAGVRSVSTIDGIAVTFRDYTPVAKLLGEEPGTTFAFEKKQPLLGATQAQLESAYGSALRVASGFLYPAATEWDDLASETSVLLQSDGDKVTHYSLHVPIAPRVGADDTPREEVLALLTHKLGKPENGKYPGGGDALVFRKASPRILASANDQGWSVMVDR